MNIHCKYTELKNPAELVEHPKNPNKHEDRQIDALAKIIKHQGWRNPIVVSSRSGYVVAGHGRLLAAKKLRAESVPVDIQKFDDEAQEYAHMIADNKIAEFAQMDDSIISELVSELGEDFDIELAGLLDGFDLVVDEENENDPDDFDAEPPEDPTVKPGQVWQLGKHRLMCGDSLDTQQVDILMENEKADMIFTDPPYGVNYEGGLNDLGNGLKSAKRNRLINDDKDIYYTAVTVASKFSIGPVFMFYADTVPFGLYKGVESVGGEVVALIIWQKNGGYGALGASYKPNHEPCLLWKPKGAKINYIGPTTETRIWGVEKDYKNKLHPTQKPVELSERAVSNHQAKIVLDLFGGSGSTLIACERQNRFARIMELSPAYCDVIIKRWEDYTGKKAELIE